MRTTDSVSWASHFFSRSISWWWLCRFVTRFSRIFLCQPNNNSLSLTVSSFNLIDFQFSSTSSFIWIVRKKSWFFVIKQKSFASKCSFNCRWNTKYSTSNDQQWPVELKCKLGKYVVEHHRWLLMNWQFL